MLLHFDEQVVCGLSHAAPALLSPETSGVERDARPLCVAERWGRLGSDVHSMLLGYRHVNGSAESLKTHTHPPTFSKRVGE